MAIKESKLDLVLHPIRMRILQTCVVLPTITAQQLSELMPDIPPATLYRHINKLAASGILKIVEQRPIRGAVEKVYELASHELDVTAEELAKLSRDDHFRYFTAFLAKLLNDFERYLQQDQIDLAADGVGYRQIGVYLNDEEFAQLADSLRSALRQALEAKPAPGRRRRNLATIIIPEPQESNSPATEV